MHIYALTPTFCFFTAAVAELMRTLLVTSSAILSLMSVPSLYCPRAASRNLRVAGLLTLLWPLRQRLPLVGPAMLAVRGADLP